MTSKDWVIIWLSIQIVFMSAYIAKLSYDKGYLAGRADVYADQAASPADGTCLTKNGKGC